ncbi:caspase family protein [Nannocystis sp. RBIL2]|uniref:caspase family protein n=1 Tax=Nannocystis sp. RBIL2 TaxID=2996788 RepID=UPI00226E42B2|nr:caspase family protein [Nannocystis sp. RBIL2]MCY1070980.1 caspase family protein [Nannocystis sp. RBIL2]
MTRVLLIGSAYGGLAVEPSVDSMHSWLLGRLCGEDEIDRLVGARANRAEVLAGLRRLADEDHGDAPVIVYYAGHGHLYRSELGASEPGSHVAYPLLVTIDLDRSTGGTLRSVFASELSRELRRIARRARNLTVILDCCHASGMVRLDDDIDEDVARNCEQALHREACARVVEKRPLAVRGPRPDKPPTFADHVVVVAASSAGGRAYPHPATGRMLFTDVLLAALESHTTWDAVLAATRAAVQEVWPIQQPAVFGPRFRRPFSLSEDLAGQDMYRVERVGGDVVLMAGALHGIDRGDRFELLSRPGAAGNGPLVAVARPATIDPDRTRLRVPLAVEALPRVCHAHRRRGGRLPAVIIDCDAPSVRRRLTELVTAAELRLVDHAPDLAARLEVLERTLHVRDCLGDLVHLAALDRLCEDRLSRCLRRLGTWQGVARWLLGDLSSQPLRRCYELRWGTATGSGIVSVPGPIRARPGALLGVSLHNLDRGAPELYAHTFRIRADREIEAWSSGIGAQCFAARQCVTVADQLADGTRAYRICAPPALPPGSYREWTLVCVAGEAFDPDAMVTPPAFRTLSSGLRRTPKPSARGEPRPRAFDVLVFPYTLDIPGADEDA